MDLVKKHYTICSGILYNEYGPTENTVWATVAQIPEETNKITYAQNNKAPDESRTVQIVASMKERGLGQGILPFFL